MNIILLITSVYVLWYVLNFHPVFDKMWIGEFEDSTLGKAIRCEFCFGFWVCVIPAIAIYIVGGDVMMLLLPTLTATTTQLLHKIVFEL